MAPEVLPAKKVEIGSLLLDRENPRISRAVGQDDAIQKLRSIEMLSW